MKQYKNEVKSLFHAVIKNELAKVYMLVKCGFYGNLDERDKADLLNLAIEKRHIKIVELFLKHGADLYLRRGSDNRLPIVIAFTKAKGNYDPKKEKLFLEEFIKLIDDPKAEDKHGSNILHYVCIDDRFEHIESLIDFGINVNHFNSHLETPLFTASFFDSIHCAEILLKNGAHVDHKNEAGETSLSIAIDTFNNELMELLVLHGANVNHLNNNKRTPIFNASAAGNEDAIELLIKYGVDVNHVDINGETPIFYAIREGSAKTVLLLLENGADMNHIDRAGFTPLYNAVYFEDYEFVKILLDHDVDLSHNYQRALNSPNAIYINEIAKGLEDTAISNLIESFIESKSLRSIIVNNKEDTLNFNF